MKAVILAGGLGERLRPFTQIIPKPLLPLGDKALLEIQIDHLKKHGFNQIYLATNYKSDYFKAYLGDGQKYGVNLYYSEESKPLGTCGPLTLLKNKLTEPFLLVNGDILTNADFRTIFIEAVKEEESLLSIVTKIILTPFRFGNVLSDGHYVTGIEEKPDLRFEILAGIYILKPGIFRFIPEDTYFGMDQLIKLLLKSGVKIHKLILKDYWIDIGQVDDYSEAIDFYNRHFTHEIKKQ